MKLPRIKIGRPQRLAALLLLVFLAECLWVVSHQQLSQQDYRYAECGREMWERPSPLAGYFTTCGNLNGDGTFAYRVAGLPLTVQRLAMLGADKMRKPENRLYGEGHAARLDVGGTARTVQREVSAASAVHLLRSVARRRSVVGLTASLWQ